MAAPIQGAMAFHTFRSVRIPNDSLNYRPHLTSQHFSASGIFFARLLGHKICGGRAVVGMRVAAGKFAGRLASRAQTTCQPHGFSSQNLHPLISSSSSSSSSFSPSLRAAVAVAVVAGGSSLSLEDVDAPALSSLLIHLMSPLPTLHAQPNPNPNPDPSPKPEPATAGTTGPDSSSMPKMEGTTFTRPSVVDLTESSDGKKKKRVRKKVRKKTAMPKAIVCAPPGKFDEFDNAAKACLGDFTHPINGASFTIQTTPLSDPNAMEVRNKAEKHLEIATTIDIGGTEPTCLNTTLVLGEKQSHVLVGKIDTEFGLNGRYIGKDLVGIVGTDVEVHCNISDRPDKAMYNSLVLASGYKGSDYNFSATLVNGYSNINMSYTQSVTPELALGIDVVHSVGNRTSLSGVVRYKDVAETKTGFIVNALFSSRECSLTYTRQASPTLSLASELKFIPAQMAFQSRTGLSLKHRTFQFTGMLDSDGLMIATLDYDLAPIMRLTLSGAVQHTHWKSMFGFGVTLAL
eukprot:g79429.t1